MDDARAERLAMNETLFRDVNEIIRTEQGRNQDDRTTFVCECMRVSCQLRLPVAMAEYKAVRAHPDRFVVFPGHENLEIEVVVEDLRPRYLVIEKIGPGRDVAESRSS